MPRSREHPYPYFHASLDFHASPGSIFTLQFKRSEMQQLLGKEQPEILGN